MACFENQSISLSLVMLVNVSLMSGHACFLTLCMLVLFDPRQLPIPAAFLHLSVPPLLLPFLARRVMAQLHLVCMSTAMSVARRDGWPHPCCAIIFSVGSCLWSVGLNNLSQVQCPTGCGCSILFHSVFAVSCSASDVKEADMMSHDETIIKTGCALRGPTERGKKLDATPCHHHAIPALHL